MIRQYKKNSVKINKELIGISLIVICGFILFCLFLPVFGIDKNSSSVFGVIGSFFMRFFGYMAFPIMITFLLLGIAFYKKKKITIQKSKIVLSYVALISLVISLHSLITCGHLNENPSFNKYINSYSLNPSLGGIFFGIFTYLTQKIMTPIPTIVFYFLIFCICLYFLSINLIRYTESKNFKKGKVDKAKDVQYVTDRDLYVGNIIPHKIDKNIVTQTDSFNKMDNTQNYNSIQNDKILPYEINTLSRMQNNINQSKINNMQPPNTMQSSSNSLHKSEILKKLYGEQPYIVNNNFRTNRPPKIVHSKKYNPIILPQPKDDTRKIVPGKIINGERYKKNISENSSKKSFYDETLFINSNPVRFNSLYDSDEQKEKEINSENNNKIIKASSFQSNLVNNKEIENVNDNKVGKIIVGSNYVPGSLDNISKNVNTKGKTMDEVIAHIDPIINTSNINNQNVIHDRITNNNLNNKEQNSIKQNTEIIKPKFRKKHAYIPPSLDLLSKNSTDLKQLGSDYQEKALLLEQTLESFNLPAKVVGITKGPAVTRYELELPPGVPIRKIEQHSSDIAYNLESRGKIRIETPIPGRRAVGIEVPNVKVGLVCLRDVLESNEYKNNQSNLTIAVGKDIAGNNIICSLDKMPHLLIAGATNSGKSACLNAIIISFLYKSSPDDVKLILIDPKRVEFSSYYGLPHLMFKSILTEPMQAINALNWAIKEMEARYKLFSENFSRNIIDFNTSNIVKEGVHKKLPYIVLIIDELADLMMSTTKRDVEDKILKIANKARAAGIHMILATQRPSVDVITGSIKNNLPSRIAFAVPSAVDSRTILDRIGAEMLVGRGDMLYSPIDINEPRRVQGAYVTNEEVSAVVNFVKENNDAEFDELIEKEILEVKKSDDIQEINANSEDPLMPRALRCVIESGQASASMLQRRFSIGFTRAARIIDQMEFKKFIGPSEGGSRPREVYITKDLYNQLFGEKYEKI